MIAVRSIVEADRYHCFCLVREKRNLLGCRYYSTDLTLEDILEREESEGQLGKLDSGFQGQYEVRKRWAARRLCPAHSTPHSSPLCPQPNQPVNKETGICTDVSAYLNLRHAQKSCKEKGMGEHGNFFFLETIPK